MHRTQSYWRKVKYLKKKKEFMSSVKGVSHLSRRAKRRLYCKLQLWMWRRRREKCYFGTFRTKRQPYRINSGSGSCLGLKTQSQKIKRKCPTSVVSSRGSDSQTSKKRPGEHSSLLKPRESAGMSEMLVASSSLQNHNADTNIAAATTSQTSTVLSQQTDICVQSCEFADALHAHTVANSDACGTIMQFKLTAQRLEADSPKRQRADVTPGQNQAPNRDTDEGIISTKFPLTDLNLPAMTKDIYEFLDGFYRTYGSFIPLKKSDVLRHLKKKFNADFTDRKNVIVSEVVKYQTVIVQKPLHSFQVVYKKHTLTLDDLSTLADQNWLNDQVMNMYGELIMESANHEVHFLNSFFHRQLMTKGYDGVKRWTKQVDLFSKSFLLVPIHLEVHWCLVTADFVRKRICLYDSQGNALQKVARNILKYLMAEAKEKQQTAFEVGWTVSFDENIPQQTNENDCGVFVLEYSRCLALSKPLQFSQKDIPKIRKRIYKELCDCKLHEEG